MASRTCDYWSGEHEPDTVPAIISIGLRGSCGHVETFSYCAGCWALIQTFLTDQTLHCRSCLNAGSRTLVWLLEAITLKAAS